MNDRKPAIYTVATAHLDTSWNWDFETTLREYLPKTLTQNFEWFEKYPEYIFSFEGSYRYELFEEYYPELFEKLREYVDSGRWNVSGSSYENGDTNIPSPEALIRNILYGNSYFDKTFGKRSADIYLPDCFGFGWALPSVAAHCGLLGFTTQKLCWSSAYGIPFDLGRWFGVDGKWIYASPDGRDYNASLKSVRKNPTCVKKLHDNTNLYDLPFAEILHGIGDRGGAPREDSVKTVCEESRLNANSDTDVLLTSTDRIFKDLDECLTDSQKAKLPKWENELIFTDHGVGGYTSRAQSNRFNRRCEMLADAAERTAVSALLLGSEYPQKTLDRAWKRTIAHQFHDDITGTSLLKCYQRNWNDYVLSLNEFSEEYRAAAETVGSKMNSSFVKGIPLLVINPVQNSGTRRCSVSATLTLPEGMRHARVFDDKGAEVFSQTKPCCGNFTVTFAAELPSVGARVYDLRPSDKGCALKSDLYVTERYLENKKYQVYLNKDGDISSIFDKELQKELLSAPIRLALHDYSGSLAWPAWEMNYKEALAAPREYASSPEFSIVDFGSARVSIKTSRRAGGSKFTQIISLDSDSDFIDVFNEIDWRSTCTLLKCEFPLAASNPEAVFDLGLGTVARTNMRPRLFEVPAQMWADITDTDGSFGVSVFSDSRTGWDKRDDRTLRLTAMHTPKVKYRDESAQHLLEIGLNRFSFGIFSHASGYENGTQISANEFNQPPAVFKIARNKGTLGSCVSLCKISDNAVIIRAVKKAQESDEIIVRFNEGSGKRHENVRFSIGAGIASAREITGDEQSICKADVLDNELIFDIEPFGIRSFALTLNKASNQEKADKTEPLHLPFNNKITSPNAAKLSGILAGASIPDELFPKSFVCGNVRFETGKTKNALVCSGQSIKLPEGSKTVFLVAASLVSDKLVSFTVQKRKIDVTVPACREAVGAWDLYALGETGYIKKETLAFESTHLHSADGDIYGAQAYFFKFALQVDDAKTLRLPDDSDIVIIAAAVSKDNGFAETLSESYDSLERRKFNFALTPEALAGATSTKLEHIKGKAKFVGGYAINRLNFFFHP